MGIKMNDAIIIWFCFAIVFMSSAYIWLTLGLCIELIQANNYVLWLEFDAKRFELN